MATLTDIFALVLAVLDRMEIPYTLREPVTGSVIKLFVDVKPDHADSFVDESGGQFYPDPIVMREALAARRPTTLIHLKTGWRFDLFPLQNYAPAAPSLSGARFGR